MPNSRGARGRDARSRGARGYAGGAARDRISRDLRKLLRGDVEFDPISRFLYATDAGINQIEPLGVVSPRDTEDVVRLVEYAAEHDLPLVPAAWAPAWPAALSAPASRWTSPAT